MPTKSPTNILTQFAQEALSAAKWKYKWW
jgi:hypothetical protein